MNQLQNPFIYNRVLDPVVVHPAKPNVFRVFCPTLGATFCIGMLLFHNISDPISAEMTVYNFFTRLLILMPLCTAIADFRALRNLRIHKQFTVMRSFAFVILSTTGLAAVTWVSAIVPALIVSRPLGPFEFTLLLGVGHSVVHWMLCWLLLHRRIPARCMAFSSSIKIIVMWMSCGFPDSPPPRVLLPEFARIAIVVGTIVLWAHSCAMTWWLVDRE